MKNPLLIYHIPKTAGVSLIRYLEKNLTTNELLKVYPSGEETGPNSSVDSLFSNLKKEKRDALKVIIGHDVTHSTLMNKIEISNYRFCTVLRDPIARLNSSLNYSLMLISEGRKDFFTNFNWVKDQDRFIQQLAEGTRPSELCLEKYLNQQKTVYGWPNFQSAWIKANFYKLVNKDTPKNDLAEKILAQFWLVGVTNEINLFVDTIAKELSIKNDMIHENSSTQFVHLDEFKEHANLYDFTEDQQIYEKFNLSV